MAHVAVTAMGADRPGIVAAVTRAFLDHGCNIEDSSMTILRGQFAMVLVVDAPPQLGPEALHAAVAGATAGLGLVVSVRALPEVVPHEPGTDPPASHWAVSVYGADRPGIVHRVAALLADEGVNIVDLTTRVIGTAEHPVYAMLLDVAVPATTDTDELGDRLRTVASELGVDASFHPADADIL